MINNAGIGTYGKIEQRKKEEIQKVVDVNLIGTINLIKNFYIHFKGNKSKLKKIINISSIYGVIPPKFNIYDNNDPVYSSEIYGATKSGIIQLTRYFAKNFSGKNITVNAISPGGILNKKLQTKKFIRDYSQNVPLGRMANVDDIVEPIIFMCSDKSNYINGQNLIIDGGFFMLKKYKNKTFIIAEAGINHNGKVDQAMKLIKYAKKAGADAVKFQTYLTEKRASKKSPIYEILKKCEIEFKYFREMKEYSKELGIHFFQHLLIKKVQNIY